MTETKDASKSTQTRRVLAFRVPLIVALLVNVVLVTRVPLVALQQKPTPVAQTSSVPVTPDPETVPDPLNVDPVPAEGVEPTDPQGTVEPQDAPAVELSEDYAGLFFAAGQWIGQNGQETQIHGELATAATLGAIRSLVAPVGAENHSELPQTFPEIAPWEPPAGAVSDHELVLINPAVNEGTVHFLFDGSLVTLGPGQEHRIAATPNVTHIVRFNRGDKLGVAEHTLTSGGYLFDVTRKGWSLLEQDSVPELEFPLP